MVEGERDNDDNDEYVYYLLMEREPTRRRGWNGGWGKRFYIQKARHFSKS